MLEAAASGLGEVRSASRTMALKWPPEPRILPSELGGHRVVWPATSRRLNRPRAGPASQGRPAQPVTGGRWGRGTAGSRVPRRPFEAGAGRVQRPCGRFERRPPARTGPFEGPVPRPSRRGVGGGGPGPGPAPQPAPAAAARTAHIYRRNSLRPHQGSVEWFVRKLQRRRCSARDCQGWCRQHGHRSRCTRGTAPQRPKPTQRLLLTLGDPISPRTCATTLYRLGVASAPMQRCAPPRSTIRPARCSAHARRSAHARSRPSRGASHERVASLAACAIDALTCEGKHLAKRWAARSERTRSARPQQSRLPG